MPLYEYACRGCGITRDIMKPLAELNRLELCHQCEQTMTRQVSAPMVVGDYAGYTCPISGDWIEGRKAHLNNLKKHGCRLYEPGETEQLKQRKAREEARFDASVENTVEQFIAELPTEKREQLAAEVTSGVTAEVVRT